MGGVRVCVCVCVYVCTWLQAFGMVTRNVVLEVPRKDGLGLELSRDPDSAYVVVSAMRPGGVVERSGEIHVGDCIICVNGHFMLDQDYATVLAAMNAGARRLSLVLGAQDQMFEMG